jgi:hypothetical protein
VAARAVQRRVQERAARKKERRIQWRERLEQRDEEYRLRDQQGLSPPVTSEYSSSGEGEEEESDRGQAPPKRWDPAPPSPRAVEAAEEKAPGAGARRRAVCGRGDAHRGGTSARRGSVWGRCSGDSGRHHSACQALE